jgi:UDP-2-acetamido-2-deoxy-ribo-hexuluronate aminotransferase
LLERSLLARPAPAIRFVDLQAQRARLGGRIDAAIAGVLAHGNYVLGPEVTELEARLASWSGVRHVVTCANGTDALKLALRARDIGRGDAVVVPAFTFVAAAEAVVMAGATPVFADVRELDFTLDPAGIEPALEAAVRAGLRPAAIIAVDLFGQPADYPAILPIAKRHDLMLIADGAQSYGATLDGRPVGNWGDVTATSFFPSKPLGCYGDGGALLTDDAAQATLYRSLRMHGQGDDRYDHQRIGVNSRLDSLQAAVLLAKLEIFEEEIAARDRIAQRYAALLGDRVRVPHVRAGVRSVWAQYTVRVPHRDAVARQLREHGVPTAIHYPKPLSAQPAYVPYPMAADGLPVSERLAREVLSLPMHAYLDPSQQDEIAARLIEALD